MRAAISVSLVVLLVGFIFVIGSNGRAKAATPRPVRPETPVAVVVELFTSEGCSDCPPADRLLYRLEQMQPVPDAKIIPLEQHVDYWDHEGWRDPFSSSQFTLRQRDYVYAFNLPAAYTPQMVVDGSAEFVGNDAHRAIAAITQAAQTPKASLQIEQLAGAAPDPRTVSLRVSSAVFNGWNAKHGADVLLAITEDDLPSSVTAGENAGVHMDHRAVVRELRVLGRVDTSGGFSATSELKLAANWRRKNLHVVGFMQEHRSRRILGAAEILLAGPANETARAASGN